MLPSEAVLLRGSSPILRQLFLAKWAESKLLSYELSGYVDIPSVPRTRPLYQKRLPSAPGGPIIVCLDTSWSMSGARETLSKAVVLACVTQAHRQGRECQVVAFSTERNVMECGIITADPNGIRRLLSFLSHSFGGGTDVTGALKAALTSLDELGNSEGMSAADILLVTDGEIPDPPIPSDVMESLDRLKLKKGVNVHGLLVGKSESKPLSSLCTHTHDFLATRYSSVGTGGSQRSPISTTIGKGRRKTALFATKRSLYDEEEATIPRKRRKGKKSNEGDRIDKDEDLDSSTNNQSNSEDMSFREMVEDGVQKLKSEASVFVQENEWNAETLKQEREECNSCWEHHEKLGAAISRVEDGLVERAEEARLVVLAMIASEHILLLGSPGTAKSVLGLRLAQLRVTTGYLPTADVAFLDEIFKANAAILNTLLTLINERKFDNGGVRENCPVRCVVAASNELPESDELLALFDRFLIRKFVSTVSDDEGVKQLLSMKNPGVSSESSHDTCAVLNMDDIVQSLSYAAENVKMDDDACEIMRDMRVFLREKLGIEISDRRLVKTARLLKICAASDGRKKVDTIDFLITQHCFWNEPEQRVAIREWLWDNLTPLEREGGTSLGQMRLLLNTLRQEIVGVLRKTNGQIDDSQGAQSQIISIMDGLREETDSILAIIQEQHALLARHLELVRSDDFTWVDPDDVKAMQQLLLPKGELLWPEILSLHEDARALSLAISKDPSAPPNDLRLEVIESLWSDDDESERQFTNTELIISMREAKVKYDLETFRRWKRAKKKADREKSD
ncbi:MAG: hypothetical protein SGILL_003347 [Bacillariaceae sp.]